MLEELPATALPRQVPPLLPINPPQVIPAAVTEPQQQISAQLGAKSTWRSPGPPAPICTAFVSSAFQRCFSSSLLQRNALVATLL